MLSLLFPLASLECPHSKQINIAVRRSALPKMYNYSTVKRAVLRLSSYLCAERIKIVKQAAEGQADRKSNRMSIKLYQIEANVN